jgi:hypothetical protein
MTTLHYVGAGAALIAGATGGYFGIRKLVRNSREKRAMSEATFRLALATARQCQVPGIEAILNPPPPPKEQAA